MIKNKNNKTNLVKKIWRGPVVVFSSSLHPPVVLDVRASKRTVRLGLQHQHQNRSFAAFKRQNLYLQSSLRSVQKPVCVCKIKEPGSVFSGAEQNGPSLLSMKSSSAAEREAGATQSGLCLTG